MQQSRVTAHGRNITGGGQHFPSTQSRAAWVARRASAYALPAARVDTLLTRYGTRCEPMLATLQIADTPLDTLPDYSREELRYLAQQERVGTRDDLLRRRTPIAISGQLTAEVEAEVNALWPFIAPDPAK